MDSEKGNWVFASGGGGGGGTMFPLGLWSAKKNLVGIGLNKSIGRNYSTVGCRRTVCRRTARLEYHLKIRTTPGWKKWVENNFTTRKQSLLWRRLLRRLCWLRKDSTPMVWHISAAFPTRHAWSRTVCAVQANLRDSKTDWKIRTRLAGVLKNKNDPGWDRLPPVLRHPTVL